MPLYEFECRECAKKFELLVRAGTIPKCPSCGAADLERALSTFAVASIGPSSTAPAAPCGRCGDPRGAGSCGLD